MELPAGKNQRAVIIYLVNGTQVCLPMKLKKICKGYRVGYGGGIEGDETEQAAAIREMAEEGDIIVKSENLERVATCHFYNHQSNVRDDITASLVIVDAFVVREWHGQLHSVEDGGMGPPEWFDIHSLPLHQLPPADRYWLPRALHHEHLEVEAHLTPGQKELIGPVIVRNLYSEKQNLKRV